MSFEHYHASPTDIPLNEVSLKITCNKKAWYVNNFFRKCFGKYDYLCKLCHFTRPHKSLGRQYPAKNKYFSFDLVILQFCKAMFINASI